jgi:protein associated with RNAse G/E
MLVPHQGRWTAYWSIDDEIELYVDVTTTPVWTPEGVTAVDLDLDVVRWRGGPVQVLDEDEFDQHREALAYPADVVEGARETAAWLAEAIRSRTEPFGNTGPSWLARLV